MFRVAKLTKLFRRLSLITTPRKLSIHQHFCIARNILPAVNRLQTTTRSVSSTRVFAMTDTPDALPKTANQEPVPAEFDKDQFTENIQVTALKVPTRSCQQYLKLLADHLLNKPRLKNTQDIAGDKDWKLLLLAEHLEPEGFSSCIVASSPQALTLQDLIAKDSIQTQNATVTIGYSQATAAAVIRRLLPPSFTEIPTAFETIGHIAHMNLRDEVLPYKYLIGQVILDKNPRLKTVVNKLGSIENEWRVFDMEVLAGSSDTETEVRQHGVRFKLDFRKVYWNSRLEREHQRLVEQEFKPGQVVLDVMAGIGPFVVPAAIHSKCFVLGNDLNPDSYKYMKENIVLNKITQSAVPYCMDGREFIRQAAAGTLAVEKLPTPPQKPGKRKKGAKQQEKGEDAPKDSETAVEETQEKETGKPQQPVFDYQMAPCFDHAVMNLPASAVEFLDAFHAAFNRELWKGRSLPTVHVYTFAKGDETEADIQVRVETALGGLLDGPASIHCVRDVAPNKQMYCVSFTVPESVAFGDDRGEEKRQRTD